ncbi:hypothetical protein A9Q95_10970 [Rhodobacterales bacterium 59_46_T64]|nr:hypothetical protein A9Q95_10970 [Rhodobacterales bacterium 59_46_T64]
MQAAKFIAILPIMVLAAMMPDLMIGHRRRARYLPAPFAKGNKIGSGVICGVAHVSSPSPSRCAKGP